MDDIEWSSHVHSKYEGRCGWALCGYSGTDAAHIIPRSNKNTRHNVNNGILLCRMHHNIFDALPKNKKLLISKILIGKEAIKELMLNA